MQFTVIDDVVTIGYRAAVDWRYGDAGDRWPVEYGDVWRAGPHILACLDIETTEARKFYDSVSNVSLVYADPPWSTGNAKTFRTKAGLAHGNVTLQRLWGAICERVLPALGTGDLVVEIGSTHRDDIAVLLGSYGRQVTETWPIVYFKQTRCWLHRSRFTSRVDTSSPAGLDDELTPRWAIDNGTRLTELVCDPCLGRGLTVMAADSAGRRFIGSELNPRRLAVAIDRLAKRGHVPEKLGDA